MENLIIENEQEKWLSIVEYSISKNKSISTIRRYIKDNRVEYKTLGGKYYIKVKNLINSPEKKQINIENTNVRNKLFKLEDQVKKLNEQNKSLKEEILENRMLINAYESSISSN
jgi:hypothetical protein